MIKATKHQVDKVGSGKGDLLKDIWEQDVADMEGFHQDQQRNGSPIVHNTQCIVGLGYCISVDSC